MIRRAVSRYAMVAMLFAALLAVSVNVNANAAKRSAHHRASKHIVSAAFRVPRAPKVVATGRTTAASTPVVLQRLTAAGGKARWRAVARSQARHHRYTLRTSQRVPSARYRVVSKQASSKVVGVVLPRPARKPQPKKPTPTPTAAPAPVDPTPSAIVDPTQPADPEPSAADPTSADPAPAADPSPDCGPTVLKADGTPWTCTFDDEFDGTSLDRSKWLPQQYFITGSLLNGFTCAEDDPDLVNVSDGALHLSINKPKPSSPWAGYCRYTDGMVSTNGIFSQQYGRFEARVRPDAYSARGLHEAFWMWPSDPAATSATWPESGEIDVAETYSGLPNMAIPYLHYTANDNGGWVPGVNTQFNCAASRGQYNTFTLEWSPTKLTFIINGKTCLVNTSADPAFQKPYMLALTQSIGVGNNAPSLDTPMPSTMDVDYVRVWK